MSAVISNRATYAVAVIATVIGAALAGERGLIAGAVVGYFGAKTAQSLARSVR